MFGALLIAFWVTVKLTVTHFVCYNSTWPSTVTVGNDIVARVGRIYMTGNLVMMLGCLDGITMVEWVDWLEGLVGSVWSSYSVA